MKVKNPTLYEIIEGLPIVQRCAGKKAMFINLISQMKDGSATHVASTGEVTSFRNAAKEKGYLVVSRGNKDRNGEVTSHTVWLKKIQKEKAKRKLLNPVANEITDLD